MKENTIESNSNHYIVERVFLNQKSIKDAVEEIILNGNFINTLLTEEKEKMYNYNISM